MCLAIPARIIERREGDDAVVDLGGVRKTISLSLVPEAVVGDYVIVHVGYALSLLDPDEAARTLALFGRLTPADGASYLSGLLVGHEVAANLPRNGPNGGLVHLIGTGPLMALYARAIVLRGGTATAGDADAAARGLEEVPPYAVRTTDPAQWARLCEAAERGAAVAVRDAGFTEVAPGTITTITTPG